MSLTGLKGSVTACNGCAKDKAEDNFMKAYICIKLPLLQTQQD